MQDLINRDTLSEAICELYDEGVNATEKDKVINAVLEIIQRAPTVERLTAEWYDNITKVSKARHGEYVLYNINYLLENLPHEIYLLEASRRRMRGDYNV